MDGLVQNISLGDTTSLAFDNRHLNFHLYNILEEFISAPNDENRVQFFDPKNSFLNALDPKLLEYEKLRDPGIKEVPKIYV